jgi:acyl phosphate:glycerol-3-phosphate acyltransferase
LIAVAVAIAAAYLIGATPFGLLVARFVRGIDIRTAGSGNIGATNVGRVLGARWGAFVLVLDALKGALPTLLLSMLVTTTAADPRRLHLAVGCGLAAVLGHMFPCWLRFRGGKGVATALGVIVVLAPWGTLVAVLTFAITFGLSRFVSLSSMVAAVAFCIAVLWRLWPQPFAPGTWSLAAFAIGVPLLIIVRHRSNIGRLLRGEEARYHTAAAGNVDSSVEQQAHDTAGGSDTGARPPSR